MSQPAALKLVKPKKRRSPRRPGYTIAQFAQAVDQTERVIRAAVKNKLIVAIEFNGVLLIPQRERKRWQQIWGTEQDGKPARDWLVP